MALQAHMSRADYVACMGVLAVLAGAGCRRVEQPTLLAAVEELAWSCPASLGPGLRQVVVAGLDELLGEGEWGEGQARVLQLALPVLLQV